MIYFVQSYTIRALQLSANKLSTPPPTAIGDKCGFAANFFHRNPRKSVTYPEARISVIPGCFLNNRPQAAKTLACRGWQTPYPQKRQQTLGATITPLWKSAESRDFSGFANAIGIKNQNLINY
ncbi:hypothetical protein [Pseudomonas sp. Sample_10]|uniref:hypothetical protein n=1 Tax=Pseudomonas sp. Sample_10 TaxID=2448269 RepID=UPI0015B2EDBE|nr:hypothetical protein [Pseudomonas sp. Sample_10]